MEDIWELELSVMSRSESWEQLKNSFQSFLREIAFQAESKDPYLQVSLISQAYRKATIKTCELLLKKRYAKKIDPEEFTWLSFGGEARREVTFKFDQDNGIIFEKEKPELLELAEEVVDRLSWLKIPPCQGGVMASRPEWQGDYDVWQRRVDYLLTGEITPNDVRKATILLDIDYVFGNRHLFEKLVNRIRRNYPEAVRLQRILADDIAYIPSYINIFGGLALEKRADRKGKFNFKFACLYPFVGYMRVEAWKHGISECNTRERIKALQGIDILSEAEGRKMTEIFKKILRLRLVQQRMQLKKGAEFSDYFDLQLFNQLELKELRYCVKEVGKIKRRLRWLYWI